MVLRLPRVTPIASHQLTRPDDLGVTDGTSSQVLQEMGEADQEVFMNRNKNARPNELGNYFGAMP